MKIEKINKLKKRLAKDGNMLRIYRFFRFIPDSIYLKLMFRLRMGYSLDLKHPRTFNQKLQYLKLHDRRPLYTRMVDKLAVNDYVRERCGNDLSLINVLGVYDDFDEIDFNSLPEKFVLKCTHNSGAVVICRNKADFNRDEAKSILGFAVKHNFYYAMREWPYKNVPPRIIAEEYIESDTGFLQDYKIFTFGGKAEMIYIRSCTDGVFYGDYFDKNGELLDFTADYPHSPVTPGMPENLDKMLRFAEVLSEGTPELRVDFYEVRGRVYFGELTFYHDGGFAPFEPREWDEKLGNLIDIGR